MPSVTLTVKTQSLPVCVAGAGKALVSLKPLNAIPVGSEPLVTLYLKGAIPPDRKPNSAHAVTQPASTLHGDWGTHGFPVTTTRRLTEIALLMDWKDPCASETWTVNRYVPRAFGVPVILPVAPMMSPGGREPDVTSQL